MAESQSLAKAHSCKVPASDLFGYARASRMRCCALLAFAIAQAPLVCLATGRQLPLAPIELLPNAPATYHMRDWRQAATDFDTLAFETTLAISDAIRSFDLTFITGGAIGDLGLLFVDDISVALAPDVPILAGDYNDDGIVGAADYLVWRKYFGGSFLPNETATPGLVDDADYEVWRAGFASAFGGDAVEFVPEPAGVPLVLLAALGLAAFRARRLNLPCTK